MEEDEEIIVEFIGESREMLDALDEAFIALEQAPEDSELVARVFRYLHTIKGGAGCLDFNVLQSVAHRGENVLGKIRDKEIACAPVISILLEVVDAIRDLLARIEHGGTDVGVSYEVLITRLEASAEGKAQPLPPPATTRLAPQPSPRTEKPKPAADSTVRVDVALLDSLVAAIGELVLCRNQLVDGLHDTRWSDATGQLDRLTTELHNIALQTRMQPVSTIWQKLPRLVRDAAVTCGKDAKLVRVGESTELDKALLEALRDPLTHLLRNAVDHGLETPQTRIDAGKPAQGTIGLSAFHENGHVHIEVCDDGGGINVDIVRNKAIERGLVDAETAATLHDSDVFDFLFQAGFSTAAQVTNVSGRGVGMDVVKTNVEQIGGKIATRSTPGKGTTFSIEIPLTLAIIPVLIITAGPRRFAVPQADLVELAPAWGTAHRRIEHLHGSLVYRLRGNLLPLLDLRTLLSLPASANDGDGDADVVVLEVRGKTFGMLVDRVEDTQEIVVKPLCPQVKCVGLYSGATLLGDGEVTLILDVAQLAKRAGARPTALPIAKTTAVDATRDVLTVLCDDHQLGIPLTAVERIEESHATLPELRPGVGCIAYRGSILPVIDLGDLLGLGRLGLGRPTALQKARRTVVLVLHASPPVGLAVDETVDVVRLHPPDAGVSVQLVADTPTRVLSQSVVDAAIARAHEGLMQLECTG